MKKIFKWTIFKKTFLILLVSFIFVNILNVYLDFEYTKDRVERSMWTYDLGFEEEVRDLSKAFTEQYFDLNNKDFHQKITQFTDKHQLSDNVMLLDKDYNIVKNFTKNEYFRLDFIMYPETETESVWQAYKILLTEDGIEEDKVKKINLFVEECINKNINIPVEYGMKDDDVVYLSVGDIVIIDNHEDVIIEYSSVEFYQSKDIEYEKYSDEVYPYFEFVSYKQVKEDLFDAIKEDDFFEIENQLLYGHGQNFNRNNNIYSYRLFPVLKEGTTYELEGYYDYNQIEGYILVYNYNAGGISRIIDDVIKGKIPVYIVSLIMIMIVCWIISYTLSKRIKDIDKSMSKISDNDFDIHLKENSKDELGILAKNINIMSQKIKQTIDSLNDEIDNVKRLENMKSEFIANFTHEIKTPLSIINGYIELIDESKNERKNKEYLDAINKETDRINELVLAMLNLSRLQSSQITLNKETIDMDELIVSTIDSFSLLIQKKDIKVIIKSDSSIIKADHKEISTVLKNFISNAIKHTEKSKNIFITLIDNVLLIENEGNHIDNHNLDMIWDTYVSGDREGTGLGLAINKSILDLHGFSYDVYNTDRGVCFKVVFKNQE